MKGNHIFGDVKKRCPRSLFFSLVPDGLATAGTSCYFLSSFGLFMLVSLAFLLIENDIFYRMSLHTVPDSSLKSVVGDKLTDYHHFLLANGVIWAFSMNCKPFKYLINRRV